MSVRQVNYFCLDGPACGEVWRVGEALTVTWPDGAKTVYVGWVPDAGFTEAGRSVQTSDLLDLRLDPSDPGEVERQKRWRADLCLSWDLLRQASDILESLKTLNIEASSRVTDGFTDRAMIPHVVTRLEEVSRLAIKLLKRLRPVKLRAGRW